MSKRSYERRIKAKREAARLARKRAERMRKIRIWLSATGALTLAVILFFVFNGDGTKPIAQPTTSATASPATGCTPAPTPAPTPNGKKFTTAPPMTIDQNKIYVATFETSCGTVAMRMDPKTAPKSVNNFVFLARQGFFDNTKVGRVQNETAFAIVQAGTQTGGISGGVDYSYQGETPAAAAKYTRGTVAMANSGGPSSNGSQFFFVVKDWADLPANYTIFGKIDDATSLAALDKMILARGAPVDPQQNLGLTPNPPIYILKVTIAELARG